MRSRLETAARWLLWSPSRVRGGLLAAAVAVGVLAVAVVVSVAHYRPATAGGSCREAVAAFTAAFADAPKDTDWGLRVAQTVTPQARPGVSGIDPADTPAGPAYLAAVEERGGRCVATVTVPGMVLAVTAVGDRGTWLVDAWGPQ